MPILWTSWTRKGPIRTIGRDIPKPEIWPTMIELAERLAAPFDLLRVDFYWVGGKLYFGELTLHPGGGWARFTPPEYDRILGDRLKLTGLEDATA